MILKEALNSTTGGNTWYPISLNDVVFFCRRSSSLSNVFIEGESYADQILMEPASGRCCRRADHLGGRRRAAVSGLPGRGPEQGVPASSDPCCFRHLRTCAERCPGRTPPDRD